ncbi:MAG: HAD hydrolase-like protein [Clostridiales bacterium]|nr:HAD hydrolase-like protein [Clostridiales bacterium]
MIKYKYVLFDLDGTISESAGGIRRSLEQAITALGKPLPNLDDYTLYIGPPLIDTFRNVCRFDEEACSRGLVLYRDYYNEKGKYINRLYDGIKDVLAELKAANIKTAVCSSKYEKFAEEIIGILGVEEYFDSICGSNLDGSRKDKKDLIPYAVKSLGGDFERDRQSIVMLGDTYFDARGAAACGVDFIGVKYGYGDIEKMKEEGAEIFAEAPADILKLLTV